MLYSRVEIGVKIGVKMRKYLFIALGGALGAMLRITVKEMDFHQIMGQLPVNTLLINLSGSFMLAFVLTIALERLERHPDIRLGVATGFFGAFTTFSTMCKETNSLINTGNLLPAITYALLSIIFGLFFAWFVIFLAEKLAVTKIAGQEIFEFEAESEYSEEGECVVKVNAQKEAGGKK